MSTVFGTSATTVFQVLLASLLSWALLAPLSYLAGRLGRGPEAPRFRVAFLAFFGLMLASESGAGAAVYRVLTGASPGGLLRALVLGLPLAIELHRRALDAGLGARGHGLALAPRRGPALLPGARPQRPEAGAG